MEADLAEECEVQSPKANVIPGNVPAEHWDAANSSAVPGLISHGT